MKIPKSTKINLVCCVALFVSLSGQVFAVNTITHAEALASNGAITLQDGTIPTSGGVTVGYFSSTAPMDSVIQTWSAGNAVSNLISSGWVDVRTVIGGDMQANGDWDWPGQGTGGKIGGTFNWTYNASLANRQLYVFAFNGGTSGFGFNATGVVSATSSAFTSSSFSGSSQWAALRGTTWLLPANDGTAVNLRVADVDTLGELIMGTETGANSSRDIAMVPEPSTGALMMIGAAGLVALRRLRKV